MDTSTDFAPPQRLSGEGLNGQIEAITILRGQFDLIPQPLCLLNGCRQILMANPPWKELIKLAEPEGLRAGEVLGCINARRHPGGCGCSKNCAQCGAVNSMLVAINERRADSREIRITTSRGSLDLKGWSTPVDVDEKGFILFSVQDISDEKRRQVLEEVFFHDVLNLAGALRGFAELSLSPEFTDSQELLPEIYRMSERLIEELKTQRDLRAAEKGDLRVNLQTVGVQELLSALHAHHVPLARRKRVILELPVGEDVTIDTDRTLLLRILGNLYKNAIEASGAGDAVSLAFLSNRFEVRNPKVMSEEVKAQIFQRSFTTKSGSGHGMGTYSVKMLLEKYLKGTVDFSSQAPEGTIFRVHL